MPLELPKGWTSIPAPEGLGLAAKWNAVKDARLPLDMAAFSEDDAHVFSRKTIRYCAEPTGADTWLTPAETLALRAGDCEDFAIFERALLINGGFDPASLHLVIVMDLAARRDHALLWTPNAYLDCRAPRPLPHAVFSDYRPIAAFAENEALAFGRRAV